MGTVKVDQDAEVGTMICAGAAHWDLVARTREALPPGADVPGVIKRRPGGVAANVARFLTGFGHEVTLVATVGADTEGASLIAALGDAGVNCAEIVADGARTDAYLAIEAADGSLHAAVADCSGLDLASDDIARRVLALVDRQGPDATGPVVIDGNLAPGAVRTVLEGLGARNRAAAFLPASPEKAQALAGLIAPNAVFYGNLAEACAVLAGPFADAAEAADALTKRGWRGALVTDGGRAAAWSGSDGVATVQPAKVVVRSVTGAGDMLAAAHLSALASGETADHSLRAAFHAAAQHISGVEP